MDKNLSLKTPHGLNRVKKNFSNILPFDDLIRFDQIWKLKSFFKIFEFH